MYEDLVTMLQTCSEQDTCIGCPYVGTGLCDDKAKQAADAIEELLDDNAALNATITSLLEQIKGLAEVKHGHWKPWKYKGMGLLPISGYQCSRCGVLMDGIEDTPTAYHLHYCPNCGARMDESEDEE